MGTERLLLRPVEVADYLAISRSYVSLLIKSGEIRTVDIGGCKRVAVADLKRWVESKTVPASEPGTT